MIQDGLVQDGVRRVHQGIDIRRSGGTAPVHSTFYAVLADALNVQG